MKYLFALILFVPLLANTQELIQKKEVPTLRKNSFTLSSLGANAGGKSGFSGIRLQAQFDYRRLFGDKNEFRIGGGFSSYYYKEASIGYRRIFNLNEKWYLTAGADFGVNRYDYSIIEQGIHTQKFIRPVVGIHYKINDRFEIFNEIKYNIPIQSNVGSLHYLNNKNLDIFNLGVKFRF